MLYLTFSHTVFQRGEKTLKMAPPDVEFVLRFIFYFLQLLTSQVAYKNGSVVVYASVVVRAGDSFSLWYDG